MRSYNLLAARRQDLGCSLFARHYLGNHSCFLFHPVLRCFSSRGWLSFEYCTFSAVGCPIRKSADITIVCISPQLIAAYHVLHRLSKPRHPPCALICFKKIEIAVVLPPLTNKKLTRFTTFFPICQRSHRLAPICRCQGYEPLDLASHPIVNSNCHKPSPGIVEVNGVEPMTLCLQSRCSSQLSYTPAISWQSVVDDDERDNVRPQPQLLN